MRNNDDGVGSLGSRVDHRGAPGRAGGTSHLTLNYIISEPESQERPDALEVFTTYRLELLKDGCLSENDVLLLRWLKNPRYSEDGDLLLDYPTIPGWEPYARIFSDTYLLWDRIVWWAGAIRPGEPYELTPDLPGETHNTDMGNAARLAYWYGDSLLFCHLWNRWLVWDGRRWKPDDTGAVIRMAKATVRRIYAEAESHSSRKDRKDTATWAMRSEANQRISAMIKLAQSEVPVLPEQLDADPWLLTVLNGTLDLRTGELLEYNPDHLGTKIAPTEFEPGATSETWDRFLGDVTGGDPALADFLQRAVGYSLTGDYREEVLFFIHGPKNAGKSTFVEAIKAALGDYAKTADFEIFLRRSFTGGPRNDIAELAGCRVVISCEVDEGKKLAEGLIKWLTGGDTLKARFLYKEAFEFDPAMKLWLVANHAPKIKADDDAIWRRILRIPFEYSVPPDRIDKTLKQKLREAEAQRAILTWALEGCLAWQRGGLGIPPVVARATANLRAEMDPLKGFFDDCCVFGDDLWTSAEALRNEYETHCKENGDAPVRARTWGAALRGKNCERKRRTVGGEQKRGWLGIGLVTIQTDLDQKTDSEAISETLDVPGKLRENSIETGLNQSNRSNDDPVIKAAEDLGGEVVKVETADGEVSVPF